MERKRSQRRHARGRMAALTLVPLTAEQRALDPLPPMQGRRGAPGRVASTLALLIGAALVHVAVIAVGFLIGGAEGERRAPVRQEVKIEVHEKKVEPPPPPVEPPPEPERPMRTPPKVVKEEPPPPKPPEPSKRPPPRVVGLSLESTVEGGGGPSFAVGNTRAGETAERARAPEEVPSVAPPPVIEEAPKGTNKAASRIPTAGVTYEQPRRKTPVKPPYPETLKSQGLEADVTVMVNLDATGKVISVKIIRESPYPEFNEVARTTALSEQFEPATRDGVPIPFSTSFTYRFRLEEE
jgi:protein TonB